MLLIAPDTLRHLLATQYPDGPQLLALVHQLAVNAEADFTSTREHLHEIYALRLGLSREVTHHYTEGLAETVAALAQTRERDVRLVATDLNEGSCAIFASPTLSQVIGVLFRRRQSTSA
jgi:hypothetical protein